jgi:hypothetical protein
VNAVRQSAAATGHPSVAEGAGGRGDLTQRARAILAVVPPAEEAPAPGLDEETAGALAALDASIAAATAAKAAILAGARRRAPCDGVRRLTLDDLVARKIVASPRRGRELANAGDLPCDRVGRELFFRLEDVEAYIAAHRVTPKPRKAAAPTPATQPPVATTPPDPLDACLEAAGMRRVVPR